MRKGQSYEVTLARTEAGLVPDGATPLTLMSTPAASDAGVPLAAALQRGVILNRRALRRVRDRFAASREQWPVPCAQLDFLLLLPKWKRLALSGPSLAAVRAYGFTVGKIQ